MIELTASVMVGERDQMREAIRAKYSNYRVRYLEDLARQIAKKLMETPGAVEVNETYRPDVNAKVLTARVFIATEDEARGRRTEIAVGGRQYGRTFAMEAQKAQYGSMMDAMRYSMPGQIVDAEYPEPAASKYNPGAIFDPFSGMKASTLTETQQKTETLTLEMIDKLQKRLQEAEPSPIDFLRQRVERKRAMEEAMEASKAKAQADSQIRKSTGKAGKAISAIKVTVRKIQMPEEAKG